MSKWNHDLESATPSTSEAVGLKGKEPQQQAAANVLFPSRNLIDQTWSNITSLKRFRDELQHKTEGLLALVCRSLHPQPMSAAFHAQLKTPRMTSLFVFGNPLLTSAETSIDCRQSSNLQRPTAAAEWGSDAENLAGDRSRDGALTTACGALAGDDRGDEEG